MPEGQRGNGNGSPQRDIESATRAIVGGNWNNTGHDGLFNVNLNNTVSNTNTNNGAALSHPILENN